MPPTSFPKNKIKILLLENIHPTAVEAFKKEGFRVETCPSSLNPEELKDKLKDIHVLGIRSKTKLTEEVLQNAGKLMAIGCFCIGTDQVDLQTAQMRAIPVFNSPFSNSRSVAELIMCELIVLARRLGDRVMEMHSQVWKKSATGCNEIRGKTLGIVGYGHIGTQLSILAESFGMRVQFFDIIDKLSIGNCKRSPDLNSLLESSDFVTLHVPDTELTRKMISAPQIARMRKGTYLLNASRGTVVDISALASALRSGHLAGAAVDVYPDEPEANSNNFVCELQGCPNTILTPHIGGSTEEAQEAIGREVANHLIMHINTGRTLGAVNFPAMDMPVRPGTHRILNAHLNKPGFLRDLNRMLAEVNVSGQLLQTLGGVGYLIADVDQATSNELKKSVAKLESSIRTRILY